MFVCPFLTNPTFWKTWVAFFFFFFLIFNFAFLNKIVKIKVSKYIVTVPKVYFVGTEGIWDTRTYMHFSYSQIKKKKTRHLEKLLLMIINSWTRTASAAYALKIMTLTTAHSLPWDTLVYRVLGSFCTLDCICIEPGCVPSSEYAFKN